SPLAQRGAAHDRESAPAGSRCGCRGDCARAGGRHFPGESDPRGGTRRRHDDLGTHPRLGFAQHVLARHGDGEVHPVALRFDRADDSAHVHLDLTRVGHGHGAGEPHAVGFQFPRIAEMVGQRRAGEAHREHPVGDDAPEAHLGGESVVPVDRVEVPGRPGVPDEPGAIDVADGLEELLAHGPRAHLPSPRTAMVDSTLPTAAPPASVRSTRVRTIVIPARLVMSTTWVVVAISSPATSGRVRLKVSSAWTTREKSISAPGSLMYSASARWAMMTANVGGATTSSYPCSAAVAGSTCSAEVAPTASANSAIFARETR